MDSGVSCLMFEKLSGEEPGHCRGRLVRVVLGPVPVKRYTTVITVIVWCVVYQPPNTTHSTFNDISVS